MSFKKFVTVGLGVLMTVGLATVVAPGADAFDWDAWRAEREAARVAREAEREAKKAAREAEETQQPETEPACTCSTSLGLAKPDLQFTGGVLTFIPRVDFSVRARGDDNAPNLNVFVNYEGSSSYESDDVSVPAGTSFSGQKQIIGGFPCNGTYKGGGVELTRVTLPGLVRSLLSAKQELDGVVKLKASIQGCGFDEENRQFGFTMRELGNLRLGGWRSAR